MNISSGMYEAELNCTNLHSSFATDLFYICLVMATNVGKLQMVAAVVLLLTTSFQSSLKL